MSDVSSESFVLVVCFMDSGKGRALLWLKTTVYFTLRGGRGVHGKEKNIIELPPSPPSRAT